MSDVKVTREHRLRALAFKWRTFTRPEWTDEWLDTGGVRCAKGSVVARIASELHELAHMDAAAEHRVRAGVIADLRGLLERAAASGYVEYDSLELFIETLESQL